MIRVFKYLDEFDFYIIIPEYKLIADELGLSEWNEVVWIGRYFTLDNDYGEHWFDNRELRQKFEKRKEISKPGIDEAEIFIINPDRFENGKDGPCHTYEERKRFWTDVLKSLQLSFETLINEAKKINEQKKIHDEETYIGNLEERIIQIKAKYFSD